MTYEIKENFKENKLYCLIWLILSYGHEVFCLLTGWQLNAGWLWKVREVGTSNIYNSNISFKFVLSVIIYTKYIKINGGKWTYQACHLGFGVYGPSLVE